MERQGLALTDPETVGMSGARLERLCAYLQGAVDCGALPLADVAIVRHGALVCRRSFVHSALVEQGYRLTPRSRYYLGSFTKIFVATLVIQQVERGAIMLTRPAADYVPAFAARGKGAVTVRHLLAHASGLPDELAVPLETQMPLPELVAEVCAQPLVFAPGTRSSYCTWGFVILAEILRLVSGRTLEELGRDELFAPLGMADSAFGCAADAANHVVPIFDADLELHSRFNDPRVLTAVRGDTGAFAPADDLAVFGQMMLDGGRFGNVQVLSPVTVRHMTQSQYPWGASAERLAGTGEEHFVTLSKGLGWMVRGQGFFRGSDLMSPRAFFHGGYLGMRVIVDPDYDLVSVFMTSVTPTRSAKTTPFGRVGHITHTVGTLAAAAITTL
jgi:CubicO group peptidase (beta-lactamase class C family)